MVHSRTCPQRGVHAHRASLPLPSRSDPLSTTCRHAETRRPPLPSLGVRGAAAGGPSPPADAGVAAIVYTDIARDGMLTGPNIPQTAALAEAIDIPVIVSGGVARVQDIIDSAAERAKGICGVIAGRAIYTGAVDLNEALAEVARLEGETSESAQ